MSNGNRGSCGGQAGRQVHSRGAQAYAARTCTSRVALALVSQRPVAVSQKLSAPNASFDCIQRESAEKSSAMSGARWPRHTLRTRYSGERSSRMRPSRRPAASVLPSGE